MNMKEIGAETRIADYFKILGSPFRIQILYNIGYGEACVCHLEAVLSKRQAYISQHLMVLRDAGILETRREGKYIYYRVADRSLFGILESTAGILNIQKNGLLNINNAEIHSKCDCPHCLPEQIATK